MSSPDNGRGAPDETARITETLTDHLRAQEVGALATLDAAGFPSVSAMHFACDGLVAYIHTFTAFRKHADLLREPRVGYTLWHEPADGFEGRRKVRGVQVTGRARIVEDSAELDRAFELSYDQFPWLRDHDVYAGFRKARQNGIQAFFRVDPVEALWHDARIAMTYRRLLRFDGAGRIAEVRDYPAGDR